MQAQHPAQEEGHDVAACGRCLVGCVLQEVRGEVEGRDDAVVKTGQQALHFDAAGQVEVAGIFPDPAHEDLLAIGPQLQGAAQARESPGVGVVGVDGESHRSGLTHRQMHVRLAKDELVVPEVVQRVLVEEYLVH